MASPSPDDKSRPTILQRFWVLVRSGAVGLAATACDLGTLCLLVYACGVPDRVANVPSLLPGLVVMFLGNKFFAFEDRSRAILRQGGLFLVIEMIGFGLNVLFYELIRVHFGLHPLLARILGTNLVYLGFSFPLWSVLVFRQGRKATPEPSAGR